MNIRQERTFYIFQAALGYLDKTPFEPAPPLFLEQRAELQGCVTRIEELHTQQKQSREQMRGHVDARVAQLRRKGMMPLARIARRLLRYAPGAEQALKVPHSRSNAATVATCALNMAEFLEQHRDLLESAHVTQEFLEEFRGEATALASVTTRATHARQRRSAATSEIAVQLAKGMEAIATIEGLIMLHRPDDLDAWRAVKRRGKPVGRPPKKRRRRGR